MQSILHDLNRRFDHTLLRPDAESADIARLCDEARRHEFYAVCVNPIWVELATERLTESETRVVTVAGFPLGASRTDVKIVEAVKGAIDGACEIDVVANIGWLVSEEYARVECELTDIRRMLPQETGLKVIIEASKLNQAQRVAATEIVVNSGAQFVKTGTGFFGVAETAQVQTLVKAARGQIGVKAAGGIKTLAQCRELLETGATRLGCSASVIIMDELADSTLS